MYVRIARRIVVLALPAVAVATVLTSGSAALAALAEGFGWGSPIDSAVTAVVAEGFGWGSVVSVAVA